MWPLNTELCRSASQNNFKVKFPLSFRLIYLHSCWKTWTEQRVPSGCVLLSASWPRLGSWSSAKKERTAVCQPWGPTVGLASAAGDGGPRRDNVFGARGLKHSGKPIVKDKQREARSADFPQWPCARLRRHCSTVPCCSSSGEQVFWQHT